MLAGLPSSHPAQAPLDTSHGPVTTIPIKQWTTNYQFNLFHCQFLEMKVTQVRFVHGFLLMQWHQITVGGLILPVNIRTTVVQPLKLWHLNPNRKTNILTFSFWYFKHTSCCARRNTEEWAVCFCFFFFNPGKWFNYSTTALAPIWLRWFPLFHATEMNRFSCFIGGCI